MPFTVANNTFVAQTATNDGINSGPVGLPNSGFGCSTVYATNIDRIVMCPVDGAEGYANSMWRYNIDTAVWGRYRPDPTNARGTGVWADSTNHLHDFFGPAWGDNSLIVYRPTDGTIWRWDGNSGGNTGVDAIDQTWFDHYNPGFQGSPNPTAGVYIHDPIANTWTMPTTPGYNNASGNNYMSAGCGWDPNINKFLQTLGENRLGGLSTSDSYMIELDPAGGAGGSMQRFNFTAGTTGPVGRTNLSYQFVYHSRARKWILFGGSTNAPYTMYSDTWSYDAVTRTWTNLNPYGNPPGRAFGLMWYDSVNNVILLTAGQTTGPVNINSTWAFHLEYNRWTDLGITFNRGYDSGAASNNSGGVAFIPSRNAAILTPGIGNGSRDTFSFRYAIPRATATKRQWYGIPITTSGKWMFAEKHVTETHLPSASPIATSGKVYIGFGDSNGWTGPVADGTVTHNGFSYQQDFRSLDLNAKFTSPTVLDAGAVLEHPYCATADVVPKHWDFCGLAADPKRRVLWCVPGTTEYGGTDNDGFYNCIGELSSDLRADDPPYLSRHVFTFDPATQKFTDKGTNHGVTISGDFPWFTWYDAQKDRLMRFEPGSTTNNKLDVGTNLDGGFTWSYTEVGGGGNFYKSYVAWDPQRRLLYIAERETSGHLWSVSPDTFVTTDLGVLPGTPLATFQSVPSDKGYTCFDWNARLLVYMELTPSNTKYRVWTYDVDNPTSGPSGNGWTQIDGLPLVPLDGVDIPATESPYGTSMCFDPDNNMVLLVGAYINAFYGNNITRYWAIRLSDMGVSVPTNPTPSISSLSPTAGVVGTAVTASGSNFGAAQGTSTLTFGGSAITPTSWSDTAVAFTVPNVAAGTSYLVQITTSVGASNQPSFFVNFSSTLAAVFLGATGEDFCGTSLTQLGPPNGIADNHFSLTGLRGTPTLVRLDYLGIPGGYGITVPDGNAEVMKYSPISGTAGDLFEEPASSFGPYPLGDPFRITVTYSDGTTDSAIATTAPASPTVTGLSPNPAVTGESYTMSGTHFGATQGVSTLTIDGQSLSPTAWSDTQITFVVPNRPSNLPYTIQVTTVSGSASRALTIQYCKRDVLAVGRWRVQ